MDPNAGGNPTNNPKIDLLHQGGNVQQLNGAAGAYTAAPLRAPAEPVAPAPVAAPVAAPAPKAASDYVTAAQAHRPAPAPAPTPQPIAPVTAPAPTSNYVDSAQAKRPVTPIAPPPAPRSVAAHMYSAADGEEQGGLRWGVIGGLAVAVLLLVGGGGYVAYKGTHKTATAPAPTATAQTPSVTLAKPTDLAQVDSAGAAITAATATTDKKLTFTFTMANSANDGTFTPEIEVEPDGTAFTGAANKTGDNVIANGGDLTFSVTDDGLASGKYHWQARVSSGDKHGDWASFGDSADAVAFEIGEAPATVAAATPAAGSGSGAAAATPASGGTAAPAPTPAFAATGDNTTNTSIASLAAMVLAAIGWLLTRRRRYVH